MTTTAVEIKGYEVAANGGRDLLELEVVTRTQVATDVIELDLALAGGATRLPDWDAGAHVDIVLPGGMTRQYSLVDVGATPDTWCIAVLREPKGRGGSVYVHDNIAVGSRLTASAPRNLFELKPASRYVFIAGGIGITPITALIRAANRRCAEWSLIYGGRTRASMAYRETLAGEFGDRVSLAPQDEVGLLDLRSILDRPTSDCLIYCCGPEALLTAVERQAANSGWPAEALRTERFAPKESLQTVSDAFDVELAQSGKVIGVRPNQSLLAALEQAGIDLPYSCSEGTCGTCETTVLAGVVDHRDSILSASERAKNDTMMPCVSRSRGERLVLDL